MQVDKIGCMWMKVDAGGPEYDIRVPEPLSVKFAKILDIYNGIGTGTGNFSFLLVVSEPVSE